MKKGRVSINFNKLKKDYPLVVDYISTLKVIHCESHEEDNSYYDPNEKEIHIRLYYKNNENEDFFTLLLHEKYLSFE